jgi:hypothetical protein
MPSGDGYHVIVAILLLPHEPPKDEPAQQHDAANSFSNRLPPEEQVDVSWPLAKLVSGSNIDVQFLDVSPPVTASDPNFSFP